MRAGGTREGREGEAPVTYNLERVRKLRDRVAVVGIGDTDYAEDYEKHRVARRGGPALTDDPYTLGARSFQRALDDCGISKDEVDGLAVGSFLVLENMGEVLGLQYTWGCEDGGVERQLQAAAMAIESGFCNVVALVYGNASRAEGQQYGGTPPIGGGRPIWSYAYYHPWGYSSPGAHYAMILQRYMIEYGVTEEQLATVPITFRKHAMLNENAVMREPLTVDEYLNSKYVCRPLHVYDYCLINDGAVTLILTSAERAADMPHTPVLLSGFGRSSDDRGDTQIRNRMVGGVHDLLKRSSDDCYAMSGIGREDVDHFQTYDGYSVHLPTNLEGFGFCKQARASTSSRTAASKSAASCPATPAAGCSPSPTCTAGTCRWRRCANCGTRPARGRSRTCRPRCTAITGTGAPTRSCTGGGTSDGRAAAAALPRRVPRHVLGALQSR